MGCRRDRERAERLGAVLHILYLIFNEGYASSSGPDLQRSDLAHEAIRLTRAVHNLLPDEGEVAGLLALMLLTDARRPARTGPDGELIPLDEQDRALWDRASIAEGTALITTTISRGGRRVSAAGGHRGASRRSGARRRDGLAADPRAVQRAKSDDRQPDGGAQSRHRGGHGARAGGGLALLDGLDTDERLAGHHRLAAVRAHLLEMSGNREDAIAQYRAAAERTTSTPERNYLMTKAARLSSAAGG